MALVLSGQLLEVFQKQNGDRLQTKAVVKVSDGIYKQVSISESMLNQLSGLEGQEVEFNVMVGSFKDNIWFKALE